MGGAGYMREYPVEQLYRDQRLNPIHEGAEGIHGIDILGRKVRLDEGISLRYLKQDMDVTIDIAAALPELASLAQSLREALTLLLRTTVSLVSAVGEDIDTGLSNATLYLDVAGRVIASWIWLRQAIVAERALQGGGEGSDGAFYQGKILAARYYIEWELPPINQTCKLLTEPNLLPMHARADLL
jgi:hypothetical protein